MIKVNCATIPKELYESEFFGHVKGSFTGAVKDRIGRFEAADGGTIFLDEVGEIPIDLQSKLLRILQEGEYERLGEDKTRKVDVRILAATNKDLQTEVAAKRFRDDLFYRLNVFPIQIAPLRVRKADIQPLTTHFAKKLSRELNVPCPRLTRANLIDLQSYDWPPNRKAATGTIYRTQGLGGKPMMNAFKSKAKRCCTREYEGLTRRLSSCEMESNTAEERYACYRREAKTSGRRVKKMYGRRVRTNPTCVRVSGWNRQSRYHPHCRIRCCV